MGMLINYFFKTQNANAYGEADAKCLETQEYLEMEGDSFESVSIEQVKTEAEAIDWNSQVENPYNSEALKNRTTQAVLWIVTIEY